MLYDIRDDIFLRSNRFKITGKPSTGVWAILVVVLRLSNLRITAAPKLLHHHYHSLQTWLFICVMPTSGQALLMFLESVPDPSEQRSVLQTLRSPTCKGEKWDQTMPPCLTCLLALFALAVRSACGPFVRTGELFGQRSGSQRISTGPSAVWRPDVRARELSSSCSLKQGGWMKVRSGVGLSVSVEMKNTSS